jgi:hypothetical protein
MFASLAVAMWGFWQGRSLHGRSAPIVLASAGAFSLAAGVIVVHGPPAMTMIYGGALVLCLAVLLHIRVRRSCELAGACLPAEARTDATAAAAQQR